ncbi:DUF1673 family protein [Methanosarcina sp. MTP4]|uniref:DUF1673 family protein n=1 Tax=Methanosarcina sp. MTP4 TaxID=1434100 RepID=UPI001E647EED|nr:DUF1673 family protein [Methanosarcina sp. MTP4]
MKDSLKKERQEDCLPGFKPENRSLQLSSSPVGLEENRILKAHVSLFPGWKPVIIILFAAVSSFLLWIYSHENSFLFILSELILYLLLVVPLLSHFSSTVAVMPEKLIIKRPLRKPVVIEKRDIKQISVPKNDNHSLRWTMRLFYLATISIILLHAVERINRDLQLEEAATFSAKLSLFLGKFLVVSFLLVLYYIFELRAHYQRVLKVTMHSNLKVWIYTEEPEELTAILKNEKE